LHEFKELKNPLIARKAALEQQLTKAETGKASPIEPLKSLILDANQANTWLLNDNVPEMKSFLQKVGLNRVFHSQTLTVSFKKHWSSLAETTVAVRSTDDISLQTSRWWCFLTLNRTVLEEN